MSTLEATRLSLHAVAELLLAGPQYRESKTIKLRVVPGGFGTVASPAVAVVGTELVVAGRSVDLVGRTVAEVAADAGLEPRALNDLYSGGCGLTVAHTVEVDPMWGARIRDALLLGDQALALLAPEAERVLWPEHFDIAITLEEVNYGVSPGDTYLGVPYAYVGPWAPADHRGPFWNAPFGAAVPVDRLLDGAGLVDFFEEGRRRVADRVH